MQQRRCDEKRSDEKGEIQAQDYEGFCGREREKDRYRTKEGAHKTKGRQGKVERVG